MVKRHHAVMALTVILLVSVALAAPSVAGGKLITGKEMVAAAKKEIREVSIQELKDVLEAGKEVVILDVREPNEVDKGMVPMAVNIPRGLLEFRVEATVPEAAATIYVYCGTGSRSALAAKTLTDMGYLSVYSVAGGFDEWKKAGYPVQ
jgi:rhodanese-related sulfurtransferase